MSGWIIGGLKHPGIGRKEGEQVLTASDGSFRFPVDFEHGLALVVRSPDEVFVALREDFRLDGSEIVLRMRPEDRPTSYLEGMLLGPDLTCVPEARVQARSANELRFVQGVRIGGSFRVGPLVPGRYALEVLDEGLRSPLVFVTVEPDMTRDVGILHIQRPGWIEVHLAHPGIELASTTVVSTMLLRDGVHGSGMIQNGPGVGLKGGASCSLGSLLNVSPPSPGFSGDLAPGRYLLRTQDELGVAPDVFVDVHSGQTTEVALRLEPATSRTIAVRVPGTDSAIRMRLRVTSRDGAFVWDHENTYRGRLDNFVFDVPGLRSGAYRVEARSPSGAVLEREFEVLDLAPAPTLELDF